MKRKWLSPLGGLWFSILLRPGIPTAAITALPFVAALAVRDAIAESTGLPPSLKWPNDVMLSGRKVAGILLDISAEAERVNYAVIGVGINANIDPMDIGAKTGDTQGVASLSDELGYEVSRLELTRLVLEALERYLEILIQNGPNEIISVWKSESDMLGKRIVVLQNDKPIHEGIASDIGEDGSLVVLLDSGSKIAVASGDIRIRF